MFEGRYKIHREDRATSIERRIEELTEETNIRLNNAKITEASLLFRGRVGNNYNGFIAIYLRLDNQPAFLNNIDESRWYTKVREIATSRFGFDNVFGKNLDYISFNFEEDSDEKLYDLTEKKELIFRGGFDNIVRFCDWYNSAVSDYSAVVNAHDRRFYEHLMGIGEID